MKYRKLRIAWSVAWGVACLLLIVLWVRSYHQTDTIAISQSFGISSGFGVLMADKAASTLPGWYSESVEGTRNNPIMHRNYGFGYLRWVGGNWIVWIPYWFLMLLTACSCITPWIRTGWQFTLRTLLTGMTVATIGLGWLVYAMRS